MKNLFHLLLIAIISILFSGCFFAIGSSPSTVIQNNPYSNQPNMTSPYYLGSGEGY